MEREQELDPGKAARIVEQVAELKPGEVWPVSVSDAVRALCVLAVEGWT